MDTKNQLNKYQRKIIIESILMSIVMGLITGFGLSLVLAIGFFIFKIVGLWIIILIGSLSFISSSILFYILKYKPDLKVVARRVDNIGLNERVITMLELEDSESFMANIQREDAKVKLSSMKTTEVKFKSFKKQLISLFVIIIVSVLAMVFLGQEVDARYTKDYTIEFNTQGGTLIQPQLVKGSEKISIPDNPKKEGFDFIYWYEDNVNNKFDFDTEIFENKVLYANWEVKTDEDKIIEQLIKGLRGIVDRAKVSDELKDDLHLLIDNLENSIKRDDTLQAKLVKIETAREEILRRIREEIESIKIIKIGEALKEFPTTDELGSAILTKKPTDIDNAITNMVDTLLGIPDREDQIEALLQTADDIEEALEIADEENPRLRKTLQDLADYLRYLAEEIIEGDIPEDVLENEFIEEMDGIADELKDILGDDPSSPEEALEEDVEDAFEEALDDLSESDEGEDSEEYPEDPEDSDGGTSNEDGEGGEANPDDYSPTIIDGITQYVTMLESLKDQARQKLQDPLLTQEQAEALNRYINNIDKELDEIGE